MSAREPADPRDLARLSAWFDGELGEVEAAEARARLLEDPRARAQIQEWRALREGLLALQPEPLAEERLARLRTRLVAASERDARGLDRAVRLWSVAAALTLAAGAGWIASQRWLGSEAGGTAYAQEPRAFERAIEDLLAPPARTITQRPVPGGRLEEGLRRPLPRDPDPQQ